MDRTPSSLSSRNVADLSSSSSPKPLLDLSPSSASSRTLLDSAPLSPASTTAAAEAELFGKRTDPVALTTALVVHASLGGVCAFCVRNLGECAAAATSEQQRQLLALGAPALVLSSFQRHLGRVDNCWYSSKCLANLCSWPAGLAAVLALPEVVPTLLAALQHCSSSSSSSPSLQALIQYTCKALALLAATAPGRAAAHRLACFPPLAAALATPCPRAAYYALKATAALCAAPSTPALQRAAAVEAALAPALVAALARHAGAGAAAASPDTAPACAGAALRALAALAAGHTAGSAALCAAGAPASAVAAMAAQAASPDCAASGCRALGGLLEGGLEAAGLVVGAGGLQALVGALQAHAGDGEVVEAACAALADACVLAPAAAGAAGVCQAVKEALRLHGGSASLQRAGRRVLDVFSLPGTPLLAGFAGRGERGGSMGGGSKQ